MSRGEVIGIIQTITGASLKKSEQNWYYFRKAKLLPMLKNYGALQTAQTATTKWIDVTTENLLFWHGTVDDALEDMDCRNSWHSDWEGIKEYNKIDSFGGDMGETNMLAAEGKLFRYHVLYLHQLSIIS